MKYIKSPLNYIGGKYKILDDIFSYFPSEIDTFVDLFGGGFNVGINVNCKKIIYNDHINYLSSMFNFFRNEDSKMIIKHISQYIEKYNLNKENVEGYNELRNDYNENPDDLKLFVLTCYSFNHQIRFNNKKKFNTPFGKDRSCYNISIENNLIEFSNALKSKKIDFYSKDFNNLCFDELSEKDLVYCDPPYLITTGSYNDGKRGFKDWTDVEEKQLLNLLDKLEQRNIKFALSNVLEHKGIVNNLLLEWADKYNVHYIDKNYNNCNYQFKGKNQKTLEVLITNY